ncbi:amino acid adenylation domain-containing protein [Nonomuraea muscovyensis]|uniref:Amino acid adenylation domain-containing protein n=1 Tax=Nonomuraea muscovyensis TaxID=1124761 RepID=A0A7X0EXM3_9ACTN|nr:non-ribosomal peptide synthetase/MFS transporter [Nonomuraea muscovyensis]MBB6348227.1 amino acid adenylation domain-containing protein [Nonomuraea muscovyensis]
MSVVDLSAAKQELLRRRLRGRAAEREIPRRPEDAAPVLSPAQEPLWFMEHFTPGTATYTIALAVRLRGPIDHDRLEAALALLPERHESLRHRFPATDDGLPAVHVVAGTGVPLGRAQAAPAGLADAEIAALIDAETAIPLDLADGPLLRALLVEDGAGEHVLALLVHHIVADGRSAQLLMRDLLALYRGEDPPSPAVLFGDVAAWQRERTFERELAYWKDELAGLPRAELPADRARPARQSFDDASHVLELAPDLVEAVTALGRAHGATRFMTLLAAFQALLARLSGQDDFAVGAPVDGRTRPELDDVVGMFVNTLVLRARLAGDPTFAELVARTRDVVADALDHQELPFARLVDALGVPRDPSRQPLVDTLFSMHDLEATDDAFPLRPGSARHDLELYVVPSGRDGLACAFTYKTALFDEATIARIARHLETLLRAAVAEPDLPVSRLPLPGDDALLASWNDTSADFPATATLHGLVEEQVARTPDAPAVTFAGASLTYRELDERANQVAHRLLRLGAGPGTLVAVCAERSFELVAGLLGVLKAGAAYVPLDPEYPEERLAFMLADSGAPVVLTQRSLAGRLPAGDARILPLDDASAWTGLPVTAPAAPPGEAAYMIYTSGSTGRPKGVPNSHRGIVNRLDWMQKRYRLTAADTVLQKTPAGFDVSVWEFFWPLIAGARLALAEPGGHRDPAYLRDLINAEHVTTVHFVPSMLSVFLAEEGAGTCDSLRTIICSGEELPVDLAVRCLRTLPAELHNLYGPTEAAIDVSSWQCTLPALAGRASVPIGSPIQNITLHVLDRHGVPVPVGVPGELHIGGVGVALGYHDRPELTAERFAGGRYRTGDAARWLPDGTIEFLGRLDNQVKLRGLRIELGEIEAALRERAGAREAVVIVREDVPGDRRLVAYLVGAPVDAAQTRAAIRGTLPDYMLPSTFVTLDELPLTPNGKLDRAALPAPVAAPGAEYAEPRTDTERAIAAVWREVLSVERVGADDDFFDLGGHSLLAIQVVARLRKARIGQVGLVDVFAHRTVRELAAFVDEPAPAGPRPLLQRLTGRRTASLSYVCVPYGSGSAVVYQPLADALPADQALYALAIPGHDVGLDEEPMEFAALAARCAEEILRIDGPIVIYGHCGVGAALAVELARLVEATGRRVEALYIGAIFPFARPRGLLRSLSRLGEFDRLRRSQSDINRLKARGVDLDELDPGVADRIVRTMRQDSKAAEEYFTALFDEPDRRRLRAPIISVIGERDPATDFYEERYREWHFLTDTAALVVLDEGGHYFLRYRAAELAEALQTHRRLEAAPPAAGATWWVHAVDTAPAEADGTATGVRPGMGRFLTIAAGQQISMIGSALTGWALPITILVDSGSVAQFSVLAVLNLAGLLISPLAGAIVDRGDRRRVLLLADCASVAIQGVLGALLLFGDLRLWQIYLLIVALSIATTFQRLAYTSAVPQLVPKHYLGHAMGVTQMTNGVAQLVVPLIAAGLLAWIGLGGIVVLDVASYVFAIAVVLLVRFPDTLPWRPREPLGTEIAKGFAYTWNERGLRAMLAFFAVLNVFLSPLLLLVSPLVLSFATLTEVSVVSVVTGLGVLLGGFTMALWGGPATWRFRGVLAATLAIALGSVITSLRPSLLLVGAGAFCLTFFLTVMNAIYSTIVQIKVPYRYHGRVFALNTLVAWSTLPVGMGLVAPLGTALFDPMLAPGGALAPTVGALIGVGPGRGIAFLYLACALGMVLVVAGALRVRRLARFDVDMPDALPDDLVGVETIERRHATPAGS